MLGVYLLTEIFLETAAPPAANVVVALEIGMGLALLVGAWLAALFVGAFERQTRAARAIRALKSTRPVEARLMVRLANAERGAMEALRAKSE